MSLLELHFPRPAETYGLYHLERGAHMPSLETVFPSCARGKSQGLREILRAGGDKFRFLDALASPDLLTVLDLLPPQRPAAANLSKSSS